MSTYGHHIGISMDHDAEPVCRVDFSLIEAQAYAGTSEQAKALLNGENTRARSIAKLKSAIDDALIESKRRFASGANSE